MNIALFGSTGRVGSVILERALEDGHHVQALVRDTGLKSHHSNLTYITGDASVKEDVESTIKGADAVISALGTDKNDALTKSMIHILPAMRKHGLRRIITIGTAGILDSKREPDKFRFHSSESNRRLSTAAEDHCRAYLMLKEAGLDWTVVCPTYLPDGERIGKYRIEVNTLPDEPSSISMYDTGDFAYSLLLNNEHVRERVGITY
ncbi:NAD(P)-dependent oxidoreductase [Jeotgalibacillus haloalkalitolerans]|uniref:SDR family oxidoreductase n=1 Tax=Jeotgalibacillus haloalkalitolerans TaxID=3104292 RepID=A0ABU5KQ65_9BACL|nr:SDR family oxidoreductase [Jeotgalibacillus sp. HH7-29]MDZ5713096.1 SDR family oxidoreductase [Jeotgalibacillus sp. HH7-29]